MPRKPRIEIAGKYHIINRGVELRGYSQHRGVKSIETIGASGI